MVLTLACGKFRFFDKNLGDIGGIPRLLDVGQCNDAYSAIQIALALADAFDCGVNDLPLSLILSWYEQKAVAILLTLLHLGIKDIRLGPTLPAFVTPNVLEVLTAALRSQGRSQHPRTIWPPSCPSSGPARGGRKSDDRNTSHERPVSAQIIGFGDHAAAGEQSMLAAEQVVEFFIRRLFRIEQGARWGQRIRYATS